MLDAAQAYEAHAQEFLRGRDRSPVGTDVVDRWSRTLCGGATVIELACGGGYPITRVLRGAGLRLWAVDSSATLVAEFGARFPGIPVQCVTVQEGDFFGIQYEGAIAIGLIFFADGAGAGRSDFTRFRNIAPRGTVFGYGPYAGRRLEGSEYGAGVQVPWTRALPRPLGKGGSPACDDLFGCRAFEDAHGSYGALSGQKVWIHCAADKRASAFLYQYQRLIHSASHEECFEGNVSNLAA